jgi:hypothetical protein
MDELKTCVILTKKEGMKSGKVFRLPTSGAKIVLIDGILKYTESTEIAINLYREKFPSADSTRNQLPITAFLLPTSSSGNRSFTVGTNEKVANIEPAESDDILSGLGGLSGWSNPVIDHVAPVSNNPTPPNSRKIKCGAYGGRTAKGAFCSNESGFDEKGNLSLCTRHLNQKTKKLETAEIKKPATIPLFKNPPLGRPTKSKNIGSFGYNKLGQRTKKINSRPASGSPVYPLGITAADHPDNWSEEKFQMMMASIRPSFGLKPL